MEINAAVLPALWETLLPFQQKPTCIGFLSGIDCLGLIVGEASLLLLQIHLSMKCVDFYQNQTPVVALLYFFLPSFSAL